MAPVRRSRTRSTTAVALLASGSLLASAAVLAACGEKSEPTVSDTTQSAPAGSRFPATDGGTLEDLAAKAEPTNDVVLAPATSVFTEGRNRLGFAVFTVDRQQITDADVAVYVAHGPNGKAQGPYPAHIQSLETDPAFTSQTTSSDPDAAQVVYVSEVQIDQPGEWRVLGLISHDGGYQAARMPSLIADAPTADEIPEVGERAPVIHTPTVEDVGDVSQIETRTPPDTMHDVDFADVVGKQPVVLVFATPALCQSRVCGPVVDVAEQVKSERPDDAAYIHMEIYANNDPNKGLRPQVDAYGLHTEPWTFVINSDGTVSSRIEGALSVDELNGAVDRAH